METKSKEVASKAIAEKEGRVIIIKACDSMIRHGHPMMLIGSSVTITIHRKNVTTNEPKLPKRITREVLKSEFPEVYNLLTERNSNGVDMWVKNPGSIMSLRVPASGLRLDPENSIHEFWIELLKAGMYPEIGLSKMPLKDQKFYIYDESAEADTIIKKAEVKAKCFAYIQNKTGDDLVQMLALFGQETRFISPKTANSRLITLAEKDPIDFSNKIKDNIFARDLIDLNMMVEYSIIKRDGNIYKYGDIVLGGSLEETIKNLRAKDKQSLKITLLSELDSVRKQYS